MNYSTHSHPTPLRPHPPSPPPLPTHTYTHVFLPGLRAGLDRLCSFGRAVELSLSPEDGVVSADCLSAAAEGALARLEEAYFPLFLLSPVYVNYCLKLLASDGVHMLFLFIDLYIYMNMNMNMTISTLILMDLHAPTALIYI